MTARLQSRAAAVALVLALDLIVLAAGWFLVVAPERHAATSAAAQVKTTEAQIEQTRNAATTAAAVATQPVIRTADLYRLAKAMPSTTDMPDVLLELSQVARASGATLLSVTPSVPTAGTGYEVVPIGLSLSGDFYSVTDALYRLRQLVTVRHGALDASGRLFSVSSVALTPSGNGKTLTATVSIQAFVYGAVPSGTATAPVPGATTSTSTTGTTTTTTPSGGH